MSEKLELKSISEIITLNDDENVTDFFIPAYQRGYRWGKQQVIDLLDDILEFSDRKKEEDEFYCLQPIVVLPQKYDDDKIRYRIIDGQQRLTTIFLILKLFNEIEFKRPKQIYNLFFETREESQLYLDNITIKEIPDKNNIDFYYFSSNLKNIFEWFEKKLAKNEDFIQKFYPILLNDIKIIWYEITNTTENEIAIFTRLNIGKIPLTNAELIKALFLLKIEDESEKILLASQWDEIEYKLQDKEFFAFLHDEEFSKTTRIEFIFDLIAKTKNVKIEDLKKDDDKYSYYIFNGLIKDSKDSENIWGEVKTIFRIFNELYDDNIYYHLVGYLTQNGKSINDIIIAFSKLNKKDFKAELDKIIKNLVKMGDKILKTTDEDQSSSDLELTYSKSTDKKHITKILFLYNVISTMNSEDSRYPFDKHKIGKWSLEHIHAQNSEDITKDADRRLLLEDELKYVSAELAEKLDKLLSNSENEIDKDKFDKLQNEIFKQYGDDISLHTIDNLALLGRDDNSSLNNSIFPSKRDKIRDLDKDGSFIPMCTKNVFLKYYSSNVTEAIKWNKDDREAYLSSLRETIGNYIEEKNND